MKLHALLVLAVGLLVAADSKDDDAKKELKKLEGTWRIVSVKRDGEEQKPEKNTVSTVSGDKFTTKSGEKVIREGTLKLNPSAQPKAVDATYTAGPDKGKTLKGIYALQEDTWLICYSDPGKDRPKVFPDKGVKADLLLHLKRDK